MGSRGRSSRSPQSPPETVLEDREWFSLDELLDAILQHVVEADTRYQMRQREAFRRIAAAMDPLDRFEQLRGASFVAGLDRFENLGLTRFEMAVSLERKRRSWWVRCWRWIRRRLRLSVPVDREQFRLASLAKGDGHCSLRIVARRRAAGEWTLSTEDTSAFPSPLTPH